MLGLVGGDDGEGEEGAFFGGLGFDLREGFEIGGEE